jgi:hypothetical protein
MANTFLDFSADADIGGPLIGFAEAVPLIPPPPFADAVDHWRFGSNAASLSGKVSGSRMSLGLALTVGSSGSGYTSSPTVALSGAGASGLVGFAERNGSGQIYSVGFSGQPQDDTGAVSATISGGGGTGATASASRGSAPTYNAASIVLASGKKNGLVSAIDDAAVYTEAYLIKRPNAGTEQRIGGTSMYNGGARGGGVGGDGFAWSTGNQIVLQTGSGIGDRSITPPASWVAGTWGVLVVSVSASGRTALLMGPDGTGSTASDSGAKVVANPQRKRAIGGIHWDFGNPYAALEIASFANWATAKTSAQMTACALDLLYDAQARGLL